MLTILKVGKWCGLVAAILFGLLFVLDLTLNPHETRTWLIFPIACGSGWLYLKTKRTIAKLG